MHTSFVSQFHLLRSPLPQLGVGLPTPQPSSERDSANRVVIIHTSPTLPFDLKADIINEAISFGNKRSMLYAQKDSNTAIVNRLIEHIVGDDVRNNPDRLRYSKNVKTATDAIAMLSKAELYLHDKPLSVEEILADIKRRQEQAGKSNRHDHIIMVDDLLSIKGMVQGTCIDTNAVTTFIEQLGEYAAQYKNSYVIMSDTPLHEIFTSQPIGHVSVVWQGQEHKIEMIIKYKKKLHQGARLRKKQYFCLRSEDLNILASQDWQSC